MEKEAYAIVESIRKWRHFLSGRKFTLVTDQRSVAYMFDSKQGGKIKNDKIQRWRIELACYDFEIKYRPGKLNDAADALSRPTCASVSANELKVLHESLCHPGVTRMHHFVRNRNLPFSIEDIRKVCGNCRACAECKPRFFRTPDMKLIKSTKPFERLSVDFKGPIPSSTGNHYFLTIVDEFSRFPFAFPCRDTSANTVIKCLTQLFSIFGLPASIHSDRGSAFISQELKSFLLKRGVTVSQTTPYNPAGNGQCEKYNGIIWKAITLGLKSKGLPVSNWEKVLPDALHSIRSLLCTATNETPHDRLFNFQRKTSTESRLPEWLSAPGPVLVRNRNPASKYDSKVNDAELIEANPQYARIRYPDER